MTRSTVEDTDTTFEELEREFGPTITKYVREVTDDKSLNAGERKRLQAEHAKTASVGAQYIKYGDKINNTHAIVTDVPCALSVPGGSRAARRWRLRRGTASGARRSARRSVG